MLRGPVLGQVLVQVPGRFCSRSLLKKEHVPHESFTKYVFNCVYLNKWTFNETSKSHSYWFSYYAIRNTKCRNRILLPFFSFSLFVVIGPDFDLLVYVDVFSFMLVFSAIIIFNNLLQKVF